MKKLLLSSIVIGLLAATSANAFSFFSNVDASNKVERNNQLIEEYKAAIKKLEAENKYIKEQKSKHPELFEKKPLYENLADKYIYRIKLNGAKMDTLNFMIKDNVFSVNMNMKREEKSDSGYFYSSQYFETSYSIPADVDQEKITHKQEGDYFTIIMPKKASIKK